jgi:hypothetical protein
VGSFRTLVPQALGLLVSGAAHLGVSDLDEAHQLQKEEMATYLRTTGDDCRASGRTDAADQGLGDGADYAEVCDLRESLHQGAA